jgi:hypothetical protein
MLCQEDAARFLSIVESRQNELRCITTAEAKLLCKQLSDARTKSAVELLYLIGCPREAEQVAERDVTCTVHQLSHLCERIGISVCKPVAIEEARRSGCSKEEIRQFFATHGHLFERDPALILNADETQVASGKKLKVLGVQGVRAIVASVGKLPHYTAMCCISASGHAFKPTFILPNLIYPPADLLELSEDAYFLSSDTGWMTQVGYLYWCHFMAYEISLYRLRLNPILAAQRILLVVDGHNSRATYEATAFLDSQGIDLLVLPAHSTHLIQPFDVGIASTLKQHLDRLIKEAVGALQDEFGDFTQFTQGQEAPESVVGATRKRLMTAFLDAWHLTTTKTNVQSAFEAAGLVPIQPDRPLRNSLAPIDDRVARLHQQRTSYISGKLITEPGVQDVLKGYHSKIFPDEQEKVVTPVDQWTKLACDLRNPSNPDGHLLCRPEAFAHAKAIEAVQSGQFSTSSGVTRTIYRYQCTTRDGSDLAFLTRVSRDRRTLFMCEDPKSARSLSKTFDERRHIVHQLLTGNMAKEQRIEQWDAYAKNEQGILITTPVAIKTLEACFESLVVFAFIPEKLLRAICHACGDVVIAYRNPQELERIVKLGLTSVEITHPPVIAEERPSDIRGKLEIE